MCKAAWPTSLSSWMTKRSPFPFLFQSGRLNTNVKMLQEESKFQAHNTGLVLVLSSSKCSLCSHGSYSSAFQLDGNCIQPFPSSLVVLPEGCCLEPPLWEAKHSHFSGAAELLRGPRPCSKWQSILLMKEYVGGENKLIFKQSPCDSLDTVLKEHQAFGKTWRNNKNIFVKSKTYGKRSLGLRGWNIDFGSTSCS